MANEETSFRWSMNWVATERLGESVLSVAGLSDAGLSEAGLSGIEAQYNRPVSTVRGQSALALVETSAAEIESQVSQSDDCDQWCSAPDWVLPAHRAFAPESEPIVIKGSGGFALLASYQLQPEHEDDPSNDIQTASSTVIAGLEPMWGFACPIVGAEAAHTTRELLEVLHNEGNCERLLLPGFSPESSRIHEVGRTLAEAGRVTANHGISHQQASLPATAIGLQTWMERRTPSFRRNLRNAQRRATRAGLEIEQLPNREADFARLTAIECQSWKGQEGDGILSPHMAAFYAEMTQRLASQGRLRTLIARLDGHDVGFILGGVREQLYRGLQLSFAAAVGSLSVGHLLQLRQLELLAEEGVLIYDLGMEMDYKSRWADKTRPSVVLSLDLAEP